MSCEWNTVGTKSINGFEIEFAWRYEVTPLADVFDSDVSDIADMQDRCERYLDTHYIARVLVLRDGVELGSSYLGSCYAVACDPAEDIRDGINGYLPQMIEEAMQEAGQVEAEEVFQVLTQAYDECYT